MSLRIIPSDVFDKVIEGIPYLQDKPQVMYMMDMITMALLKAYQVGETMEVPHSETLGIFLAIGQHHVDQWSLPALAERIAKLQEQQGEDALFDQDAHNVAVAAVTALQRGTLEIALKEDEAFAGFIDGLDLPKGDE